MWFALSSALGINGILTVPVALFWGVVIMGIDRWLITSMPIDGSRKFAMAVPRIVLAILLGTLISTPLVLRIFQSEINAQMATMQQAQLQHVLAATAAGARSTKQVTTYNDELQQLNTVINSRGAQTGNSASDPELVAYNNQLSQLGGELNHWTTLKSQYYTEYTCQLYGGANCPKKGAGPAYQLSHRDYVNASKQVTSYQAQIAHVQGEIQQRDQFLSSTSATSQAQRYQEALTQRPIVQQEYTTAVQRRNQLQAGYYAQEQAAHGILMRLEALSELSTGNTTVSGARFLLFLLFLVIECLPVTVKLLQRPGQYEAAMQRAGPPSAATTRSSSAPGPGAGPVASPRCSSCGRSRRSRPGPRSGSGPGCSRRGRSCRRTSRQAGTFRDPGSGDERADYGLPPHPEAARHRGGRLGQDAWRSEWGEPEPEARGPEPWLTPAAQDHSQAALTRQESLIAPTRADYRQPGGTVDEEAPYESGSVYYPREEATDGYRDSPATRAIRCPRDSKATAPGSRLSGRTIDRGAAAGAEPALPPRGAARQGRHGQCLEGVRRAARADGGGQGATGRRRRRRGPQGQARAGAP